MSSYGLNNSNSKTGFSYANILKKNTQIAPPEPVLVEIKPNIPEIVETKEPVKKLSDARYAKKLEKKASKKAEFEKEEKEKQDKLLEIESKSQKVYDDEYQIQYIVCKTKEDAHKKSMIVRDKIYNKLLNEAFPKPKVPSKVDSKTDTKTDSKTDTKTDSKVEEVMLSDDEDDANDAILSYISHVSEPVPVKHVLQQQYLSEEELKEFQPINKKKSNINKKESKINKKKSNINKKKSSINNEMKSNNSTNYNEMLNKACDTFIVDILSESILDKLEIAFRKTDSIEKVFVPVNIDSDVIASFKGHNFTKSGFLKNTNYYFSKQLSKAINIKLKDLRVWVNIKNVKDNEYSIVFSQKH